MKRNQMVQCAEKHTVTTQVEKQEKRVISGNAKIPQNFVEFNQ